MEWTSNLTHLTGKAEGFIVYGNGAERYAIVCNWMGLVGLPILSEDKKHFSGDSKNIKVVGPAFTARCSTLLDGAKVYDFLPWQDHAEMEGTHYRLDANTVVVVPDDWN